MAENNPLVIVYEGDKCFASTYTGVLKAGRKYGKLNITIRNDSRNELVLHSVVNTVADAKGAEVPPDPEIEPFDRTIRVGSNGSKTVSINYVKIPEGGWVAGHFIPEFGCAEIWRGHTDWHIDC